MMIEKNIAEDKGDSTYDCRNLLNDHQFRVLAGPATTLTR